MYKFLQVHKYVDTPIYLSVKKEKGRVVRSMMAFPVWQQCVHDECRRCSGYLLRSKLQTWLLTCEFGG
jgi:hypothetical protein